MEMERYELLAAVLGLFVVILIMSMLFLAELRISNIENSVAKPPEFKYWNSDGSPATEEQILHWLRATQNYWGTKINDGPKTIRDIRRKHVPKRKKR